MKFNKKKTDGTDTKKAEKLATQQDSGTATGMELSDDALQQASGGSVTRHSSQNRTWYTVDNDKTGEEMWSMDVKENGMKSNEISVARQAEDWALEHGTSAHRIGYDISHQGW